MSPYPRFFRLLDPSRLQQYCCLVVSALFIGGQGWMCLRPVLAIPNAGTVIENQATGTYQNDSTETQTTQSIFSDTITLTVAEVAGITITSGGILGSTGLGGLAYFDFILTNVGNDPTQFFIPGAPSAIVGGTLSGNIKIVGYDSDGNGSATEVALNVNVPNTIASPGEKTGTLLSADATANNGSIPAGGTIRIRVPIQIAATGVTSVSVTMGNTITATTPSAPANGQNQPYAANSNKDVYTVDNPDSVLGETLGVLLFPSESREASTTQTLTVTTTNTPDPASAGAPFDCDPYFYMLHDSGSFSQFYKIDRQTSTYGESLVIGGGFSPGIKLNALGYNRIDKYFYAMLSLAGNYNVLYRIGKNNAVSLGAIPNLPSSTQFTSGTFDNAGNYYISGLSNTLYKIAISGNTPTVSSTINVTGLSGSGDIAFNPVDSKLYAANKSSTTGINLRSIDNLIGSSSSSTTITTTLSTGTTVNGSIGAIFFDSIGTLYAYSDKATNVKSAFYQMPNVASGSTTITFVSSAADSGSSDGASCPFIPPRIDVIKSVGTITKVNATTFDVPFTIKVGNTGSGSSPNVQVTENLAKAFVTGTPTITVPTAPTVTSTPKLCTINPSFDGITTNTISSNKVQLLTGTDLLAGGASCTIALTAHLVYSNAGSVPTTENNSVYASTTAGTNIGYAFPTSDTLILPPDLYDLDTSTNGSNLPASVHADASSPTPIAFPTSSNPNVLLVKRITAINGLPNKTTGESIAGYEHFNTYDDNVISIPAVIPPDTDQWPNPVTFLLGSTNGGTVKPKDSIDYTIYFLSTGTSTANNVLFCDRVPANVTFNPNTFPPSSNGAVRGIAYKLGTSPLDYYTNAIDGDFGQYFPPGVEPNTVYPKINCGRDPAFPNDPTKFLPNDNGAVVVRLNDLTVGSSGFVRFRGVVK